MAEDKENVSSGQDAAVADRVEKLEELIQQNEALRKQSRVWSLVGVLLILTLLLVFVYRIWNHFDTQYITPIKDDHVAFLNTFVDETGVKPVINAQARIALQDLRDEVMNDFAETFYEELERRLPEIEEQAKEMGGNLTEHAEQHLTQRLNDALADSLEQAFTEVEAAYPTLKDADLQADMNKARDMFVEQLTASIETRYERVDSSLQGLQAAVERVRNSEGSAQLATMQQGEVVELLIDSLVDAIVYELKPELGAEPAKQ